jgi:hypothetical protein
MEVELKTVIDSYVRNSRHGEIDWCFYKPQYCRSVCAKTEFRQPLAS